MTRGTAPGRLAPVVLLAVGSACGSGSGGSGATDAGVDGTGGGSSGAMGSSGGTGSGAGSSSGGSSSSSGPSSSSGSTGSSGGGSSSGSGSSGSSGGATGSSGGDAATSAAVFLSPYKDTTVSMNWNTNVVSTMVSGAQTPMGSDLAQEGASAVTLAFATGECGSENWGGVPGDVLAAANVGLFSQAGVRYIVSTGGAAGAFTCATDAGMSTFLARWASPGLVGVDFDIEAGQTSAVIEALIQRIVAAHTAYPALHFSLTLGTLAANAGATTAQSLGVAAPDAFDVYGDEAMAAAETVLGFSVGAPSTWPAFLTVNLMTMDYGSPIAGVCVVVGGQCQMGQSALQAAYDLHDRWGVPYSNIELTPMIGGNDVTSELFTLADADTVAAFALGHGLAGVHYWSYDRDVDCARGSASATCNSSGVGAAGPHGYLLRFLTAGLR